MAAAREEPPRPPGSRPHRGPKPGLSLERIVAAAIRVAGKAAVILLITGYARNDAAQETEAAVRASGKTPDEWMASYAGILTTVADPPRFPPPGNSSRPGPSAIPTRQRQNSPLVSNGFSTALMSWCRNAADR
jgi:hypothetical protein